MYNSKGFDMKLLCAQKDKETGKGFDPKEANAEFLFRTRAEKPLPTDASA